MLLFSLVLSFLLVSPAAAAVSIYCSTYCAPSGCTAIGLNTCTSCGTNWVVSGSTCAPATGYTQIDETTDISGAMVFSPSTTTTAGGYTYVGNISSASTVTLTLSGGMTQPHFSLELDCWMITLDGPSWIQTNQISIALGGGSTQTRVLSTKDDLDDVLSAGSNQSFYRIAETFAHTAVSTQIQFTFSTNQATGKKYGIKECILLAQLCDATCLTCSAGTATTCLTCGSGRFFSTGSCLACSTGCATCTSTTSTTCLSCLATYGFLTNACYKPCQSGYFLSGGNCTACASGCATCTTAGTTSCLSCIATWGFLVNSCLKPCGVALYLNGGNCSSCFSGCASCTAGTNITCLSCSASYGFLVNACYNPCPTNYFLSGTTCLACYAGCATCGSAASNACLSCSPTYGFLTNTCNNPCPANYYLNGGNCSACFSGCATCSSALATNCLSCAATYGFLVNACLKPCGANYWLNGGNCSLCSTGCASCTSSTSTTCTSCQASYGFLSGSCYSTCPVTYWMNGANCTACSGGCDVCTSSSVCTTCSLTYGFLNNACYNPCPSTYFNNGTNCTLCFAGCATCSSSISTACFTCTSGFGFLTSACFNPCPAPYYLSGSNCTQCPAVCFNCTSPTVCQNCAYSYGWLNNFCYNPCPSKYFMDGNNCTACSTGCLTCTSPFATDCQSCIATYGFLINACYLPCPSGYYLTGINCTACSTGCNTCTSTTSTTCLSCIPTYGFIINACYKPCPLNYFLDGINCTSCASGCETCNSAAANDCNTCRSTFGLLSNTCYRPCPANYYLTGMICTACYNGCATCTAATSTTCLSCSAGFGFITNACYNPCPTLYFLNGGNCTLCSSGCQTCSGTASTACLSCIATYGWLSNSCYLPCPAGTFLNGGNCTACDSTCATCTSASPSACVTCSGSYGFANGTCFNPCPAGFYQTANKCMACNTLCILCSGTSTTCSSCTLTGANMAYLLGSTCYQTCPNPTYPDTNGGAGPNLCLSCNAACASCTSPLISECQSCATGFKLSGSICDANCLIQYGGTTTVGICIYCDLKCTQCFQIPTNCTACTATGPNAAYYITIGVYPTCTLSCPATSWVDTTNRACVSCPLGCLSCTSNTFCDACNTTLHYLWAPTMCYLTCPPTYYASNSTNCSLCKQGCATCVNIPTNCISCVTTGPDISFLLGSQCITSCPQPYYGATFPNVCTFCNAACQACTGPSINECQICMPGYKINNLTCSTTCLTGYGPTSNTLVCIWCNLKCASSSCTNVFDNCTSCTKTGPFTAYLATVGTSYPQCLSICPAGQYGNNTDQLCHMCDVSCVTCVNTSTKCLQCAGNAGWLNYACYNVCTNGYFLESNQVNSNNVNCAACYNCTLCEPVCETCTGTSTTCKSCPMTGVHAAYLLGNSCVGTCPNGYYNNNNGGLGPNLCTACFVGCQICAKSTTNCSLCAAGYFFFEFNCSLTCPTGYIGNIPTGTCLTQSIFSVNMTMKINFSDESKKVLNVDITFTKPMDFKTFNMSGFQTYSVINPSNSLPAAITPTMFSYNYTATNSSSYRITITPIGYLYLNNITLIVTTITQPTTGQFSVDGTQLNHNVYNVSVQTTWWLTQGPTLQGVQSEIVNKLATISDSVNKVFTQPYLQEIRKTGIFNAFFTGAQLTSTSIVSNTIPAQNAYEGARFWSSFVYFDTPNWQQNLNSSLNIFSLNESAMVSSSRLLLQSERRVLFDVSEEYWHFQRTGFTTVFVYDCYIQMGLILISWIVLLIATKCFPSSPHLGKIWTFFHKVHEISLFFITLGAILEWIYFDPSTIMRIASFSASIAFTLYFFAYELYLYYDMLKYPTLCIGTDEFDAFVVKYGSMLKNIRFEDYEDISAWSPKHWIRPYNYHILSYYKKYLMIIAMPLFYQTGHAQMAVLIVLQALEIVRFCLTRPFTSRSRNIIRLILELVLLMFFISSLSQELLINKIMLNDPNTITTDTTNYYAFGWISFITVFVFNISFIIIMIYDIIRGFRKSNRQFIIEARQNYFFKLIKAYEDKTIDVEQDTVNCWVRKGGLREGFTDENMDQIKPIHVTIEKIKVVRYPYGYVVSIDKALEVFRKYNSNYKVKIRKVIDSITVTKGVNQAFFDIFEDLFQNPNFKKAQEITVKTALKINLSNYGANEQIPISIEKHEHFQFVIVERTDGKFESFPQVSLRKGFPIDIATLKPLLNKSI